MTVDGFREGDLVSAHGCPPEPIARFVGGSAHLDVAGFAVAPDRLTRKPVEVGDTVRVAGHVGHFKVLLINSFGVAALGDANGPACFAGTDTLVAVAPTVKP